ncbi:hypothetical protein AC1031_016481 [Aphanomyces cochlioides]|nr:hypothetical protein AC1031_016481 [Aphanomyces cochlioides]
MKFATELKLEKKSQIANTRNEHMTCTNNNLDDSAVYLASLPSEEQNRQYKPAGIVQVLSGGVALFGVTYRCRRCERSSDLSADLFEFRTFGTIENVYRPGKY